MKIVKYIVIISIGAHMLAMENDDNFSKEQFDWDAVFKEIEARDLDTLPNTWQNQSLTPSTYSSPFAPQNQTIIPNIQSSPPYNYSLSSPFGHSNGDYFVQPHVASSDTFERARSFTSPYHSSNATFSPLDALGNIESLKRKAEIDFLYSRYKKSYVNPSTLQYNTTVQGNTTSVYNTSTQSNGTLSSIFTSPTEPYIKSITNFIASDSLLTTITKNISNYAQQLSNHFSIPQLKALADFFASDNSQRKALEKQKDIYTYFIQSLPTLNRRIKIEKWLSCKDAQFVKKVKDTYKKYMQKEQEDIPLCVSNLQTKLKNYYDSKLPTTSLSKEEWVNQTINTLKNPTTLQPLNLPDMFKGTLKDYQEIGVAWLTLLKQLGLGGCLADDMGLGKTVQIIAFLAYDIEKRSSTSSKLPSLIVCDVSLLNNWQEEFKKFAPTLKTYVYHGPKRIKSAEEFAKQLKNYDVIITTYSLIGSNEETIDRITWENIILDEAHAIKNAHSTRSDATKSLKSNHRIALTGTPIMNEPADIWSIMDFLNPGLLGTGREFNKELKDFETELQEALDKLIQPLILRRKKTDSSLNLGLPHKIERKIPCTLTSEQISKYKIIATAGLNKIAEYEKEENSKDRSNVILTSIMRLKQLCDHPDLIHTQEEDKEEFVQASVSQKESTSTLKLIANNFIQRSGKFNLLKDSVQAILNRGEKVLIFTQFSKMAKLLQHYLQHYFGQKVFLIDGDTKPEQRAYMVDTFNSNTDNVSLFVLSLKAGGVGLNLTAANNVIHFDRWWNPATENQATDRAHRLGQTKDVNVDKYICKGTIEDKIDEIINNKSELTEYILEGSFLGLGRLNYQQVKKLFTLELEQE